jgi:hypothetical protein
MNLKLVAATLFLLATPAFAIDCLPLVKGSVDVFDTADPDTKSTLLFPVSSLDGRFEASLVVGTKSYPVVDGMVKATGSDTCSVEFTVRSDVYPGVRYQGVARIKGQRYLLAGTHHLLSLRIPIGLAVKPASEPVAFPFYARGVIRPVL